MTTPMLTEALIDGARYPLDWPDSDAYRRLLQDCWLGLEARGAAVLEGFVPPAALVAMLEEVTPALPKAFYKEKSHSPYLIADDPTLPATHPRNRKQHTNSATLGYADLPEGSALDRLYGDPGFVAFLAEVLGYPALFPYADSLTPVNVLLYRPGQSLGWHFDVSTFVVTLVLSEAESGGVFEYVPFLRSDEAENYDRVGRVLDDQGGDLIRELKQGAGALVIFRGSRTLHRVSRVEGRWDRMMAVFSYSPQPGTRSDPHNLKTFYGRTS